MTTQSKKTIFLNSAFQSHYENHVPPTNRAEVQATKIIQHSAEHKHGEK
jgi:hypothetical protein